MIGSFIFGIFVFNYIFKGNFHQHYFGTIFPVFALIIGQVVVLIRNQKLLSGILALFLIVNAYILVNSSIKYPLSDKINLVAESLDIIGQEKFSLYTSVDPYIESGGWTELYTLQNHYPVKSYQYDYWEWIYKAYSLYPGPIQNRDPERIVWIQKADEPIQSALPLMSKSSYEDINIYIFDNSNDK